MKKITEQLSISGDYTKKFLSSTDYEITKKDNKKIFESNIAVTSKAVFI